MIKESIMKDVVIVSACRTAIGSFGGTLRDTHATTIAKTTMQAAIQRAGIEPAIIDDVRYEYTHEGVNIELQSDSDVSVDGYPNALRSALENVLRNAASYGGGEVQVSLRTEPGHAVITVQDQGGGVPEPDLEHLFEPFYRAATSGESHGAGLGLAIAARAIAMHEGSIGARNAGQGLCVEMRLPR